MQEELFEEPAIEIKPLQLNRKYIIHAVEDINSLGEIVVLDVTDHCYKLYQTIMRKPMIYYKDFFHKYFVVLEELGKIDVTKDIFM